MPSPDPSPPPSDVIDLLQSLLRFDTTNRAPGEAVGELAAARWVQQQLGEVGWDALLLAPPEHPERASVVLRVPGTDPELSGLLVHAHLDVVPAEPEQWQTDPFAGVVRDGYVWGRGAADMKDMCAMTLAVLLEWGRTGRRPRRDVVVAFVADEETDGALGAHWLAERHPELFAGVEAAIGESGGTVEHLTAADGRTVALARIAAGERGTMHLRLTANGRSGHGSRPHAQNPVATLLDALHRIAHHRWPVHLSELVRAQLQQTADALGHRVELDDEAGVERALVLLGDAAEVARFTVRASTTPTVVQAGYKVNVIPGTATAQVDVRCPPGYVEELVRTVHALVGPDVELEHTVFNEPVQAPIQGHWLAAMTEAIQRETPDAVVVPACMGGGTDAKAFSELGIACYGFAPHTADPDGRRLAGVHGVDERVPVESVRGGLRVLTRFLDTV